MSDISIGRFIQKAQQSEGTLRIAKGTTDEIVNKGTIGNRLATFFRKFGEALHLVRPNQPEREERQQRALESFREALKGHYGQDVARTALGGTGLDVDGTKLTSDLVLRANRAAREEVARIRQENLQGLQDFAPPRMGEGPSESFVRLGETLDPQVDVTTLSSEARSIYASRLKMAVQIESGNGRTVVDPERVEAIARQTLKEVARLDVNGKLQDSERARANHVKAMHNVLVAVERGESPRVLLQHLRAAQLTLAKVTDIEMPGKDVGGEDIQALNEMALARALHSFPPGHSNALRKSFQKALGPDGALHALNIGSTQKLQDMMMHGAGIDGVLDQDRQASVGIVYSQTLSVTRMIAKAFGPVGVDNESDMVTVSDRGTLNPRVLERAMEGLTSLVETIPRKLPPDQMLLKSLRETFPPPEIDLGDIPDWDDVRVQTMVESLVRDDMGFRGEGLDTVVARFREAVDTDETLPVGLAAKIHAALDAMQEEDALYRVMQETPGMEGVKQEDLWRMFVPGHTELGSKWEIEHHNQGSLAGLYRGFRTILENQRNGIALDGAGLEGLHRSMTEGSFRGEQLRLSYKSGIGEEQVEMFQELARIPPGLRSESTNLALRAGISVSEDGLAGLRHFAERGGHVLTETRDTIDLQLEPGSPEELRRIIDDRLTLARRQLETSNGTDEAKRLIIAGAIQEIYRSHPFMDGNTRTIVFMAMNALLIEAGMGPAILDDPRFVAGHSVDELARDIAKGQENFLALAGG